MPRQLFSEKKKTQGQTVLQQQVQCFPRELATGRQGTLTTRKPTDWGYWRRNWEKEGSLAVWRQRDN